MPWYYNYLQIYGNQYDINTIYESDLDFQKLHPSPLEEDSDTLMWRHRHWGSCSNRNEFYITRHYPTTIEGSFRTPSVPHAFLAYLTIICPSLHITCMFEEEDFDIVGTSTYTGGVASVKYIRPAYARLDVLREFSEKNRWFDYNVYIDTYTITDIQPMGSVNVFEWNLSYYNLKRDIIK